MPDHSELTAIARLHAERLQRWWHLRRQPAGSDDAIRHAASVEGCTPAALTDLVVGYLWAGQQRALTADGTLAYYPGAPSIYGPRNDAIEGVTRVLPLWAAAAAADAGASARSRAMQSHLRRALLHGCDPSHRGYWGDVEDQSTLVCEAADVALALWLSRDWLWASLDAAERSTVAAWLRQSLGKRTADNNWHLFVVTVDAVLAALVVGHDFSSTDRLQRALGFARADGCFADGPQGPVDLYNAWGFHYLLFWLGEIKAGVLPAAARSALDAFCGWYRYLFTSQGTPLWGRSLCYRLAISAPLLAGALRDSPAIDAATAVDAYATTLKFFIGRGALQHGRPSQGVFADDLRWLDAYSGPASSLWGTRSMTLYLHGQQRFAGLMPRAPMLPAETEAVALYIGGLGARLTTDPAHHESVLLFDAPPQAPIGTGASPHRLMDRLREWAYARASRQSINLLDIGERRFSSRLDLYQPSGRK